MKSNDGEDILISQLFHKNKYKSSFVAVVPLMDILPNPKFKNLSCESYKSDIMKYNAHIFATSLQKYNESKFFSLTNGRSNENSV